jgi:hypothetical protein
MRAAFERVCKANGLDIALELSDADGVFRYTYKDTEDAWWIFQICAAEYEAKLQKAVEELKFILEALKHDYWHTNLYRHIEQTLAAITDEGMI